MYYNADGFRRHLKPEVLVLWLWSKRDRYDGNKRFFPYFLCRVTLVWRTAPTWWTTWAVPTATRGTSCSSAIKPLRTMMGRRSSPMTVSLYGNCAIYQLACLSFSCSCKDRQSLVSNVYGNGNGNMTVTVSSWEIQKVSWGRFWENCSESAESSSIH